ncbi:radical SAM protein [Pelosinus sp. sgz500959]|uniref:radical SAM protein n=1 Tax=Pelosinus sp. sgz500959 TaxID=3242472 RepID=UPI00366DDFB4
MYIQITTRCNFHCPHCWQEANEIGEDMTMATFRKAIALSKGNVVLGGGEPTIHPRFMDMLRYAKDHKQRITVITNGSMTEISLKLAKIKGIKAILSQDQWHDPIDLAVIDAFGDRVQTVVTLNDAGRAKGLPNTEIMCKCAMVWVKPNGNIYACGCETELLGTVTDKSIIYPDTTNGLYCSILGSSIERAYKETMADLEEQRGNMTVVEYEDMSGRILSAKYSFLDEWEITKKVQWLD